MKEVLLLGGTGAMGEYLAQELIDKGYRVFVTTRQEKKSTENLRYIQGDARSVTFMKECLERNFDAIVDFMVYTTREFAERVDLLTSKTNQYVFVSSYRVFANSGAPISERSPRLLDVCPDEEYLKSDEYGLAKARQEDILRGVNKNNWTIVRPSITYSKNRLQLVVLEADTVLFRSLQNLPVVLPRELMDRETTMTWAGDVAKMMALLIGEKKALGDDFNVVTSEHNRWSEIARIYEEGLRLDTKYISLKKFLGICGNRYQVLYDRAYDRVLDNTKVLEITGMEQKNLMKLDEGLRREIRRSVDSPKYGEINYRLNGSMDRISKSHIDLSDSSTKERIKYYVAYLGLFKYIDEVKNIMKRK